MTVQEVANHFRQFKLQARSHKYPYAHPGKQDRATIKVQISAISLPDQRPNCLSP